MIKKVVALSLAVVMVLGTITGFGNITYAISDYPGADKLKEFGFIHGNKEGDLLVNKKILRAEACVLLAQMYDEKEEASVYRYKEGTFPDVNINDWYAPYVGYAYSRGWIKGCSDGTFKPRGDISVQMWATMLLQALGYYESWNTAVSDLNDIGVKIYATNTMKLNRGEAFDAMWAAVNKPRKGADKPLGEEVGKLKPKKAVISKIRIPSLQMLDIYASEDLDPDTVENISNYGFLLNDEEVELENVVYNSKRKRIRIFFKTEIPSGSELIFANNQVEILGGGRFDSSDFKVIEMKDKMAPEVVEVESLGTRAIKFVFSEPVKSKNGELSKSDFVFGKQVVINKVKLQEGGTVAIIELSSRHKGDLVVKPQRSIKDYSGLSLLSERLTVKMEEDDTPIQIEDVTASNPSEITVKLNKGILKAHTSSSMYTANGKRSDGHPEYVGDTLKIKFTNNYLKAGENVIKISRGALTDYSGNSNGELSYKLELEEDNEEPFAEKGVEFESQDEIKLVFNEPLGVSGTGLQSRRNYQLFQDGENVSDLIKDVSYDSKKCAITIRFSEKLLGEYRLETLKIEDVSGNDGSASYDFEIKDIEAPNPEKWSAKIYNKRGKEQMIRIHFDEAMEQEGSGSVLEPKNYMFDNISFDQLDQSLLNIEINTYGDTVQIHYPGEKYGGVDFDVDSKKRILVSRVADISGNATSGFANRLDIQSAVGMSIDFAELVAPKLIRVGISEDIEDLDIEDLVVVSKNKRVYFDVEMDEQDGKTILDLVFEDNLNSPITLKTVKGGTRSRYGEPFKNSGNIEVKDKIGPQLEMEDDVDHVYYNERNRTIVLNFTEDIDPKTVSSLSFEVPGIEIDDISAKGSKIKIVIASADRDEVEEGQLIRQRYEVRDKAGNAVNDILTEVREIK